MASRKQVDDYRNAQNHFRNLVVTDLETIWNSVRHLPLDDLRDELVELIPAVIDRYGSMSAAVAADWFEELTGTGALVPDLYDPGAWRSSTRWALSPAFRDGDMQTALVNLIAVSGRHVTNHGRFTVDASTRNHRDVFYARVPSGPTTCGFCLVLASRGPVYGSKRLATRRDKDGGRYHDSCDCVAVPMRGSWIPDDSERGSSWEGDSVAGYNFNKMYDENYKPYHRDNDSVDDVVARMREARQREAVLNK